MEVPAPSAVIVPATCLAEEAFMAVTLAPPLASTATGAAVAVRALSNVTAAFVVAITDEFPAAIVVSE